MQGPSSPNGRAVERRALTRGAVIATAAVFLAGGTALLVARPSRRAVSDAVAPTGVRIRVQVLNATATRGLGRRATAYLRDRGFDVVAIGTAGRARDSTLVLDRISRPEWARLVAAAFGDAPVESRPDSSGHLDVTVLIGRDWAPPAEPFYP